MIFGIIHNYLGSNVGMFVMACAGIKLLCKKMELDVLMVDFCVLNMKGQEFIVKFQGIE